MKHFALVPFVAFALLACGAEDDESDPGAGGSAPDTGIAVLGDGTHDLAAVAITEIGLPADGLNVPRDVAFHHQVPGQLWVVNFADNSVVIYSNAGQPGQVSEKKVGAFGSEHFLAKPSALAFGVPGLFATIHDEDQPTQGNATPADFMGPTMWLSGLEQFEGGDASHMDMLHNSPNGMGIAWERDNVYWVFDGYHSSITRYDFVSDHGPSGTDHSDGIITRYAEGQVRRVAGVPSHLEFQPGTGRLFIADSGNGRIGVLETAGTVGSGVIGPNYDQCTMNQVTGVAVQTLIDGNTVLAELDGVGIFMPQPAGIAIVNTLVGGSPYEVIFVTDMSNSTIYGFGLDGVLLDWIYTGLPPGSLAGITFDPEGNLYVADALGNRILKIAPAPAG